MYIPALHRNLLPLSVGYTAVTCLQKLHCITSQKDHAMIQVVTPWPFTLEAWFLTREFYVVFVVHKVAHRFLAECFSFPLLL